MIKAVVTARSSVNIAGRPICIYSLNRSVEFVGFALVAKSSGMICETFCNILISLQLFSPDSFGLVVLAAFEIRRFLVLFPLA